MADFNWGDFLKTAVPAAATGVGGYLAYKGATGAAATQSAAAQNALDFEKQQFATQQVNLQPYLGAGRAGLGALLQGMGLAPFNNGGGGSQASPYAQNSPYGSQLLGNISKIANPASAGKILTGGLEGAATGAGIGGSFGGPLGAGIGAAVGGGVGTLKGVFGKGKAQENATTQVQNAVSAEVDRITKAVNLAQQNGTLSKDDLTQALSTVKGLQSEFGDATKGLGTAGQQGAATLSKYFDPMTSAWQNQLDGKGAGDGSQGSTGQWTFANAQGTGQQQPLSADQGGVGFGSLNKPFSTSDFVHDPGYDARLAEGQKQLDKFYASKGLGTSGGAAKSAANYGQTFASNEYQNAFNRYQTQQSNTFNRLADIAGIGQQETNVGVNAGTTQAGMQGGLITDIGAAQAAGQAGGANALTSALGAGANIYNQSSQLRDVLKMQQQYGNYLQQNQVVPGSTNFVGPTQNQAAVYGQ